MRLMHERELFGGRVRARSLGEEPVMRAKRVRSVRSSAVAAAEGPFECHSAVRLFELVGCHHAVAVPGGGRDDWQGYRRVYVRALITVPV